jgi:transposase
VRVTTAFKRLLRLPGASVADVSFGAEGVIVTVHLRRRRRVCAGCGQTGRQLEIHDRRVKRWRHLDLGASRCIIECELRRLRCRDCGIRLEPVPWARPGAAHTRDFEDVVAWLAQQMARTPICGLLRVGWDTVGRIVARVVAEHLDERRLEHLVCIGVDEISYRRHHRYLTSVADHRSGADRVVPSGPQQRHPGRVLRRARAAQGLDPGGLDRHERRVPARHPRSRAAGRDLL